MAKNIALFFDGTNNQITGHSTNVLRLFRMCPYIDGEQITYYDGGVGTLADPMSITAVRRLVRRRLDSAIGFSLRDNFCEAYSFLARVYAPEDRIFIFGFSRGAYTARALAGALHRLGLIRPHHENLVRYAWAIYSDEDRQLQEKERFASAARFQKVFCETIPIHFVGVWDTVSSLGWIWDYKTLPNTAQNSSIKYVRHAVAIDERRACFRHNLFARVAPEIDWKQIWFAGVHSDVGGGYPENEAGLAKLSLEWMAMEAGGKELKIDPITRDAILGATGEYSPPDPLGVLHNSLSVGWWPLECLPRRTWRSQRGNRPGGMTLRMPNVGRRRTIPEGAVLHPSVQARMDSPAHMYKPRNLPKVFSIGS